MTKLIPSDVIVGQYLQMFCLCVAAAIAFTYTLGYMLGVFIHQLNDRLSVFVRLDRAAKLSVFSHQATNALRPVFTSSC